MAVEALAAQLTGEIIYCVDSNHSHVLQEWHSRNSRGNSRCTSIIATVVQLAMSASGNSMAFGTDSLHTPHSATTIS